MKNETYKSLRHDIVIDVPTSTDEYNTLAKKADAALSDAINHTVYHNTLGDVREAFCDLIVETTGIARREIGTGEFKGEGADKKEVTKTEKPDDYYKRVCAEKGLNPDSQPFADLAKRLSAGGDKEVKFDPSVSARESKPKKLPDEYRNAALRVITNNTWDTNRKILAATNGDGGFYGKDIGEQPTDQEAAIGVLGWAIREYTLNKQKAEAQSAWK